jgi:Sel1 repeat
MLAFGNSSPVSSLAAKPVTLLVFVLSLQPLVSDAQVPAPFPGAPANLSILQVQGKAEEVFERGNYQRAYFIYREELAPIGDKYSQYMVGYMYLTGKGVPEDKVLASAWYRLAAERDTPEFVKARDELMNTLTSDQRAVSDRQFVELKKQLGDLKLLMNAVRSDYEILRSRTGSKVGSETGPMTVIDPKRMGASASGAEFYGRIERRMEERLDYIARHTNVEISDLNARTLDINELETLVDRSLDSP